MKRINKFLQLQFCMLLLLLTVLPEFNLLSALFGFNFDIPKFCCKVLGLVGEVWLFIISTKKHNQNPNNSLFRF